MKMHILNHFCHAVSIKDFDTADSLIESIIKTDILKDNFYTIFSAIVAARNMPLLEKIFHGESYIDYEMPVSANRKTPLIFVADYGWLEAAEFLLKKGANINAQERGGYTPLIRAVQGNHEDIVDLLLKNSPDITIKTKIEKLDAVEFAKREYDQLDGQLNDDNNRKRILDKLTAYSDNQVLNRAISTSEDSLTVDF